MRKVSALALIIMTTIGCSRSQTIVSKSAGMSVGASNHTGGQSSNPHTGTNLPMGPTKLLFSDLQSGPKTGWEGSLTRGAAVTVWGSGFGSSRGSNHVVVNGAALQNDSDYAEWGVVANNARGLQRIAFWLNSACADGDGAISVVVDGVSSNLIPFKVRSGNIYFINKSDVNSSDSNNGTVSTHRGGIIGPWRNFYMVDPARNSAFQQGDIIYVRSGAVYNEDEPSDGIGALVSINNVRGTIDRPYAIVGYPGEWPQLGDGGAVSRGVYPTITDTGGIASNYVEFHKLLWKPGSYAIWVWGTGWRLVGNRFEDNIFDGHGATLQATNTQFTQIKGNVFRNNGFSGNNLQHQLYVTTVCNDYGTQDCNETHDVDISWNEISEGVGGSGSETFSLKTWTPNTNTKTYNIYFHHNYIHDEPGEAIWLYAKLENIYIYNNIFENVNIENVNAGIQSQMSAGNPPYAACNVYFYNNTMYKWGTAPYGGMAIMDFGTTNNWQLANNIFYGNPAAQVLSNTNGGTLTSTNDLFYNYGSIVYSGASGVSVINSVTGQDPGFVDLSLRDFRLTPTSPARDAGTSTLPVSVVTDDFNAVPRPQSSAPDIGAYEFY